MNNMQNNIKKYKFQIIIFVILLLLFGIVLTPEYSLYRMLSCRLFNYSAIENPNISTKCVANLGVLDNLEPYEKETLDMMFGLSNIKKNQGCIDFIKSDYSLTNFLIYSINSEANNDFERLYMLLQFIITHKTSVTDNAYGFSYKCKDSDSNEKVCEISNNDDSFEQLYMKRIGMRWLLMKIEQKSL